MIDVSCGGCASLGDDEEDVTADGSDGPEKKSMPRLPLVRTQTTTTDERLCDGNILWDDGHILINVATARFF